MIVFVEVVLADASEFVNEPLLQIYQEEGRFVMRITGADFQYHPQATEAKRRVAIARWQQKLEQHKIVPTSK